jgi:hypothetical protein
MTVLPIEASPANLSMARDFLLLKWNERAEERGLPPRRDLSGSCKFSSLFARTVFGAEMRGNQDHQFNILPDGSILDLNADAEDVSGLEAPHHHDPEFWGNPEHLAAMRSCDPRVAAWIEGFSALVPGLDEPDRPEP